ncbi:response regulator transcription factor [bacterium]|nr:MAG: response regulator transcription factor [bacterium]
MNVLIVEDEPGSSSLLAQTCSESGYVVRVEPSGVGALDLAKSAQFEIVILDVILPGLNGLKVCRQLRMEGVSSLLVIISARSTVLEKVAGLDAGADDYIAKPFCVAEVMARMRALLRRRQSDTVRLQVGDLILNTDTRQAIRDGKYIHLSTTEYSLLEFLMRNAGRTMPRSAILDYVWQYDFAGNDNILDVYIGYLRAKIDRGYIPLIHTLRGIGYRLGLE